MNAVGNQISRRPRRGRGLAVAAVATAALLLTGCLSADQSADLDLINQARTSARLAKVGQHTAAADKAQAWSVHMARTGVLEHTGGGTKVDTSGLTGWCSLGENVGKGRSVQAVHDAFMASPNHKAHILGSYNVVGTGVFKSGTTYWVTEIFLKTC